jgi:hypothetical protein
VAPDRGDPQCPGNRRLLSRSGPSPRIAARSALAPSRSWPAHPRAGHDRLSASPGQAPGQAPGHAPGQAPGRRQATRYETPNGSVTPVRGPPAVPGLGAVVHGSPGSSLGKGVLGYR